ncbi:DUF4252 domain-containing protein [Pseudotamlana carrageenivorans]|nr:DUF4252 domain-containing protein [Tamlana carrageenivorans]
MKNIFRNIMPLLLIAVLFTSCNNSESLQRYFVEHQEAKGFVSQDFPLSMIEVDQSNFTEKQQEAYQSVQKLNFLGFKVDPENQSVYETELAKVKTILSNEKYNELIDLSDKGKHLSVKYLGENDEADEFILFGYAKERGFAVVRVLGHDMTPKKMISLVEAMKNANIDETQFQKIGDFFR